MSKKVKYVVETPYGKIKTFIEKDKFWFAIGDYAHCIGLKKSFQISRKIPKEERLEVREGSGYYPTAYMLEDHLDVTIKYFRGRQLNRLVFKHIKDVVIPKLKEVRDKFFIAEAPVIERVEATERENNHALQEVIEDLTKRVSNLEKVIISLQAEKLSKPDIQEKKPDIQEKKADIRVPKLEPINPELPKVIPMPRNYIPKEYNPGKTWRSWIRGMIHQVLWRAQDLDPKCSITEQHLWSNLYKRVTTLTGYDLRDLRHELAQEFNVKDNDFALLDVLERQPNLRRIFIDGVLEMAERANLLDYKVSKIK